MCFLSKHPPRPPRSYTDRVRAMLLCSQTQGAPFSRHRLAPDDLGGAGVAQARVGSRHVRRIPPGIVATYHAKRTVRFSRDFR